MKPIDPAEANIYVIRQKLAVLKRMPGESHYQFEVGRFQVKIWTNRIQDGFTSDANILSYNHVDVNLYETPPQFAQSNLISEYIHLDRDFRFINYQPIKYNSYNNKGDQMPILQLCELIKYLYKLSRLSAFL